ncbi:ammonia-forming cytochrome c nitrite reductase subunit c552 [Desulfitobacterium hafniense]|nr:ammonia-forming cytochrome c nitrite reductase subunit c552 [Desulfitobacterium hafniense]KTE91548.1 hypothetical protein AT727_21885 [Desulfitobacterium hafniense]
MNAKKLLLLFMAAALSVVVGCSPQSQSVTTETKPIDWKSMYPAQYYSSLGSADHLDDVETVPKTGGYGHGSQSKYMPISIEQKNGEINATCISCKSSKFNELYEKYGNEVFNATPSAKYAEIMTAEDWWSCGTCHSDMTDPAGSVGAQIVTAELFGKELFDKLDPKTAACSQCHNNLSPWSDSRIVNGSDILNSGKSPYRYGWDPDALIKATLEDAVPDASRYPNGKTMELSAAAHAKVDESTGTYLIANGNHADAEMFQGSLHEQLGVSCTDCHMPTLEDRSGEPYTSHDASKSVLNSEASMNYCLSCHSSQGLETVKDMYNYVRNAQAELAEKDAAVADKLDETYGYIEAAVKGGTVSNEVLDKARFNYAVAAYYKEYVYGNRGATPGEKVAHNPKMSHKYLERAIALLDETIEMLR